MEFNEYGIQHLWKLNEDEKDALRDRNGTNVGSMTYTTGKMGQALDCTLTAADRIEVGNIDVNNTQAMSISAWVRYESAPTVADPMRIISKATSGALGDTVWQMSIVENGGGGDIIARARLNGTETQLGTVTPLVINTWYLITMTYDKVNFDLFVNTTTQGAFAYALDINTDPNVDVAIGDRKSTV